MSEEAPSPLVPLIILQAPNTRMKPMTTLPTSVNLSTTSAALFPTKSSSFLTLVPPQKSKLRSPLHHRPNRSLKRSTTQLRALRSPAPSFLIRHMLALARILSLPPLKSMLLRPSKLGKRAWPKTSRSKLGSWQDGARP